MLAVIVVRHIGNLLPNIAGSQALRGAAIVRQMGWTKTQRRWNLVKQMRGKDTAQNRKGRQLTCNQVRQSERGYSDGSNRSAHRADTAAKPTHSTWKANIGAAHCICCIFDVPRRCSHLDDARDRRQRTRQPSGEKIREQAERHTPLWAIVASDPNTRAGQASIAAMTPECTAAVRMEWAAR